MFKRCAHFNAVIFMESDLICLRTVLVSIATDWFHVVLISTTHLSLVLIKEKYHKLRMAQNSWTRDITKTAGYLLHLHCTHYIGLPKNKKFSLNLS